MMEIWREYIYAINWKTLINGSGRVLLILAGTWVALVLIRKSLAKVEQRLIQKGQAEGEPPSESAKRVSTLMRLVRQGSLLSLWIIVILVILKEVGVDIAPVLAGAGIIGLAVGFGAQNLVRDIISGFFFILENQVRVGDVAIVNGTGGLVVEINFRTIVLRDISGVVHIFPNGTVDTLSNMTNDWSAYVFEIGVAYKEDTDRVTEVLKEVCQGLRQDEIFGHLIIEEAEIFGVDKFDDSAVVIKGRIKTKPIRQWMVGREFLRRVKQAFDAQGIEIPFPHRTIYRGDESKPFELQLLDKLGSERSSETENEKIVERS